MHKENFDPSEKQDVFELQKYVLDMVTNQCRLKPMSANEIVYLTEQLIQRLGALFSHNTLIPVHGADETSIDPQVPQIVESNIQTSKKEQLQKNTIDLSNFTLVADPQKAITDQWVMCCICGEKYKVLSEPHLMNHGLTKSQYFELCGYAGDTPLMAQMLRTTKGKALQDKGRETRIRNKAIKNQSDVQTVEQTQEATPATE